MNLEILQKRKKQNIHTNTTIKATGLKKPQKKKVKYIVSKNEILFICN